MKDYLIQLIKDFEDNEGFFDYNEFNDIDLKFAQLKVMCSIADTLERIASCMEKKS